MVRHRARMSDDRLAVLVALIVLATVVALFALTPQPPTPRTDSGLRPVPMLAPLVPIPPTGESR